MFLLSPKTMRQIDARSIEAGIPGLTLMERAGAGAARAILARSRWLLGTTLVVCGRGNNGGDGLVVARLLRRAGHEVEVLLVDGELSTDCEENRRRYVEEGGALTILAEAPGAALTERDRGAPGRLVIDAGLGTGFTPPLRAPWDEVARVIGSLGRRVVALDNPTGLDGSTGAVDAATPRADLTVCFGYPKWGNVLAPGRLHCGRLVRVDLEFPRDIAEREAAAAEDSALWVDRTLATAWWPDRAIDAHKYSVGSVLVVGGSTGMSGAPTLATLGAYRAGAGLVETVVPGRQSRSVDVQCPEALVHGVAETGQGGLSPDVLPWLEDRRAARNAMVLGVGGGADVATAQLFLALMQGGDTPRVIDADALGAIHRLQARPTFPAGTVLTPHSGELTRALGVDATRLVDGRRAAVVSAAKEWNAIVLHKGAPTFVASPRGDLAVIGSGGPGLATAGTGDVLSGVIAALLAQGIDAFEAAALGAYLHGRAGDLAEIERGVAATMARDVVEQLNAAAKELEETRR